MRLLAVLLLSIASFAHSLENRLAGSSSPYLAMHGQDPVHWQPWSAEVLELAQREGKLIFISSGYFSCHWCHVMQRESYRNPEIAAILNRYFIPVKVDRELNPALDEHLIDFVQRTQGRAGWPLNVFLTPEGYPVTGMTYAPPGKFKVILERLHNLWSQEREQITDLAKRALEELVKARRLEASDEAVLSASQLASRFQREAMKLADELSGGFGQQSRFPMTPQLETLLQLQRDQPREEVADFLRLTLEQMASQGMRDQLGGGFFRYTVDPHWKIPHYEKMLYSQALLAILYLDAARILKEPGYRQVAFDTLDFVLREMKGRNGGFVASFSAVDGRGVEGGYYLWKDEELRRLLSESDYALARRYWKWEQTGEGLLPLRGESPAELAKAEGVSTAQMQVRIDSLRQRLLDHRARRSLPVDHKQLAGWNGLLLVALARASVEPGGEGFRAAGEALVNYLLKRHWNGKALLRAVNDQGGFGEASLGDYAWVAWGMDEWSRIVNDARAASLVGTLLETAWREFHDHNGWRSSQAAILPGMPAVEAQEDGALPAPTARIYRLSLGGASEELRRKAEETLPAVRKRVQGDPFWYASHLALFLGGRYASGGGTAKPGTVNQ